MTANKFEEFLENINYENAGIIKEKFNQLTTALLEGLLNSLLQKDEVSTGLVYKQQKIYSQITFDEYNDDQTLSWTVNEKGIWNLKFTYWDENSQAQEIEQILNKEQRDIIPGGLKNILMTTLKTETPISVSKNTLLPTLK